VSDEEEWDYSQLGQPLMIDVRQWNTHKKLYLAGCQCKQVEPNQRVMSAMMKGADKKRPQEQRSLEGWTVAKEPQWSKWGLMEHIVDLVVVDDQVRHATFIYVTRADALMLQPVTLSLLACDLNIEHAGLFPDGPCSLLSVAHVPMLSPFVSEDPYSSVMTTSVRSN
jgi:hypothetical protein